MSSRRILTLLFLGCSAALLAFLLLASWRQANPDWKPYQLRYYRLLAEKTGKPEVARTPLGIKQIYLPELGRTDRCVTCHLGVDHPKMADAPQPFRTHPDYQTHPVEQYGCTVCHGGQGMALTKRDAHGFVKHWERPLFPKPMMTASCLYCHEQVDGLKGAERLVLAKQLFDRLGCIGCHAVNGWGGPVSTDLAMVAYKPLDEFDFRYVEGVHAGFTWNFEHFKDPQRVNPGDPVNNVPPTPMPQYGLTDDEAWDLTALVFGFWREDIPWKYRAKAKAPSAPPPAYASAAEHGRAVFQKYGCVGCHGIEGRGGVKNPNAVTGEEVPPLTYVAQGFTKDQLQMLIRAGRYPTKANPRGPTPPLWMPTWKDKIAEDELEALVEYVVSLYPPEAS